jgi:hypothetical protein
VSDGAQQSRWWSFWDKTLPLISAIIGGLIAIGGSYFTTRYQVSAQAEVQKAEEQRKVFAKLMGRKLVTEQLNVSRIEARIFSDYYEEF